MLSNSFCVCHFVYFVINSIQLYNIFTFYADYGPNWWVVLMHIWYEQSLTVKKSMVILKLLLM